MIFAAGLGTRLMPLTANKPKALVKYKNKTLLTHAIEKLVSADIKEIIVNVHHFADQIIEFVAKHDFGARISISDERDELLDTGGGLKKASWFFDQSPFIVYNVDVISNIDLSEMISYHNQSMTIATLAIKRRKSERKLLFNEKLQLNGWENQMTNERIISREDHFVQHFAFSGIQILDPIIFDNMPDKNKFSVIELYLNLAKKHTILGYIDKQDFWLDLGKPAHLNQ